MLASMIIGHGEAKAMATKQKAYRAITKELACHGECGPTLKWSPRTNYGCHKRSPPAITGPGRTIGGNKIIVTKSVRTIFCAV